MIKRRLLIALILCIASLSLFAAEQTEEKTSADKKSLCLIEKYKLSGKYSANIIPKASFIKLTGTETKLELKKVDVNRLQLLFSDFHTGKMPYAMSVDVKMNVLENSEGKLQLEGEKGLFRAVPVDKNAKKKEKISQKASIKGNYIADKDKDRFKEFSFVLKPGFWMPVSVEIEIKQ